MAYMRKRDLMAFCNADRDRLLERARQNLGLERAPIPADVLDHIIEDVLGYTLVPQRLAGHVLGQCDFAERRIGINSRLPELTMPNTKVERVENSTKAHELGHVRLGHEREVRPDVRTLPLPLFDDPPPHPVACQRDWEKSPNMSRAERSREYQADVYASVFLVPQQQLMECLPAEAIEHSWRTQKMLESKRLWSLVLTLADTFRVSGSLMAWRLVDLGWITRNGRELAISEQAWMPPMGVAS